ncbi:GNAT family N-acetyltransferase [Citricoccus sp. NPDC079358]|uniref:GNAT family N-acetyltransferase n=1 Tax=Citricoccus sp. NPDC079358 TaxID=3154653 RepID=UPI00344FB4AD
MATRRAGPGQAGVVGRLLHEFNTEFGSPTPSAEDFTARFGTLLVSDDVLVLLAGSTTAPTGFAFLTLRPTPYGDGPLAQLEELYVRPGQRGQGLGTELLLDAIEHVRARGSAEMHINVDEIDEDTRRFYERHGFTNIQPGEDYRMLCYLREF